MDWLDGVCDGCGERGLTRTVGEVIPYDKWHLGASESESVELCKTCVGDDDEREAS